MSLLLDTHVAIWAVASPERIPREVRDIFESSAGRIAVSAAAIWEIAIKHPLKRPDSPPFSGSEAVGHFDAAGFRMLDVTPAHAAFVDRLPPINTDPFDRLMLAQAVVETMQFVTYDRRLSGYDVPMLTWT